VSYLPSDRYYGVTCRHKCRKVLPLKRKRRNFGISECMLLRKPCCLTKIAHKCITFPLSYIDNIASTDTTCRSIALLCRTLSTDRSKKNNPYPGVCCVLMSKTPVYKKRRIESVNRIQVTYASPVKISSLRIAAYDRTYHHMTARSILTLPGQLISRPNQELIRGCLSTGKRYHSC